MQLLEIIFPDNRLATSTRLVPRLVCPESTTAGLSSGVGPGLSHREARNPKAGANLFFVQISRKLHEVWVKGGRYKHLLCRWYRSSFQN